MVQQVIEIVGLCKGCFPGKSKADYDLLIEDDDGDTIEISLIGLPDRNIKQQANNESFQTRVSAVYDKNIPLHMRSISKDEK